MGTIFKLEEYKTEAEAIKRIELLKKAAAFWKLTKIPEEPKFHEEKFWIAYQEEL